VTGRIRDVGQNVFYSLLSKKEIAAPVTTIIINNYGMFQDLLLLFKIPIDM
jgi:hypothetical protein